MELAANPAVRDPGEIPEAERRALGGPVGFIGHWEPVTERRLLHLVRERRAGEDLRRRLGRRRGGERAVAQAVQHRFVIGDEYARAIVSFDVNLGIVSKWNRNHTASRTFQIPALGAFLLHERNELVTRYFKEGVEAEFFDSDDELLEKCRHYLAHPGGAAPDRRRRPAALHRIGLLRAGPRARDPARARGSRPGEARRTGRRARS